MGRARGQVRTGGAHYWGGSRRVMAAALVWQSMLAGVGARIFRAGWGGECSTQGTLDHPEPPLSFPFPDRPHVGTWAQEPYRMQDATDTVRGLVVELSSLK